MRIAEPKVNAPTKEQVRAYMQQRSSSSTTVPEQVDIRRQLGWYLKEKAK